MKQTTCVKTNYNNGGILLITDGPTTSESIPNGSLVVLDWLTVTCDNSANGSPAMLQVFITTTGATSGTIDGNSKILWASNVTVPANSTDTLDREWPKGLVGWSGTVSDVVGVVTYNGLGTSGAAGSGLTIEVLVDGAAAVGEFISAGFHYETPSQRRE